MILSPPHPTWHADLARLLENHSEGTSQIDSVFELVKQHLPAKLYRYRPENHREHKNLQKNSLWFRSPRAYNDPYDCTFNVGIDDVRRGLMRAALVEVYRQHGISPVPAEIQEILDSCDDPMEQVAVKAPALVDKTALLVGIERLLRRVQDFLESLGNRLRVCSFTQRNDSVLMWSHYADQHRGICLEYDTEMLLANSQIRLYPVLYSPQLLDVTRLATAFVTGGPDDLPTGYILLAILQKWDAWAYEAEWRALTFLNTDGTGFMLDNIRPSGMFLGAKMPERSRERISRTYKGRGIKVERMRLSPDAFRLVSPPHVNTGS